MRKRNNVQQGEGWSSPQTPLKTLLKCMWEIDSIYCFVYFGKFLQHVTWDSMLHQWFPVTSRPCQSYSFHCAHLTMYGTAWESAMFTYFDSLVEVQLQLPWSGAVYCRITACFFVRVMPKEGFFRPSTLLLVVFWQVGLNAAATPLQ